MELRNSYSPGSITALEPPAPTLAMCLFLSQA